MTSVRPIRAGFATLALLLLVAPSARAQDGVGFRFLFGRQAMSGDLGQQFDPAVDAEFSILVPISVLRVGGGANWASFKVHDAETSWSQVRFHALASLPIQITPWLRPYLEARYTFRRLRPEEDRYFGGEEEILGDFVSSGSGFEGVVGAQLVVHPRLALDLSGGGGTFSFSPDLSEGGLGALDSGRSWTLHAGVSWFPANNR